MTIDIKLFKNEKETSDGFPLAVMVSHKRDRKRKNISFSLEKHFNQDNKMITEKHPDYDILAPILMSIKLKARKLILQGYTDVDQVFEELFAIDHSQILFMDYAQKLVAEMKNIADERGKFDLKASNKVLGNIRCYENVLSQFENFSKKVTLQNLDFAILEQFKNYNLSIGNSKATINLYLRTLRAIYNKGILYHKFSNQKPFTGLFSGLKAQSFNSRKKYLDRESLVKLENLNLQSEKQKYVDLFLLAFYFGGCDLIDLYYLKTRQLRKGRVVFERTKTNTGTLIDLKIHPKAALILDKYKNDTEWVFSWKKENASYVTFRGNYQRDIVLVQVAEKIEIQPDGGNLGIKVARHTFANLAKVLNIETDVIRELMGHQRNDVDNYYKDKYPEAIRDKALFDIIG
jgi:hypothetical protein